MLLLLLLWADGLVDNPPDTTIAAGEMVRFIPISRLCCSRRQIEGALLLRSLRKRSAAPKNSSVPPGASGAALRRFSHAARGWRAGAGGHLSLENPSRCLIRAGVPIIP